MPCHGKLLIENTGKTGQKSVRYQTLGTSLVDGEEEFVSSDPSECTIIHRERNISQVFFYVNGTPPVKY